MRLGDEDGGQSLPLIVGVSAGVGGFLILLAIVVTAVVKKRRSVLQCSSVGPYAILRYLSNPHHTLHHLLPEQTTHKHQLRIRRHDRQLLCKSKFDDSNFITRLLFIDRY